MRSLPSPANPLFLAHPRPPAFAASPLTRKTRPRPTRPLASSASPLGSRTQVEPLIWNGNQGSAEQPARAVAVCSVAAAAAFAGAGGAADSTRKKEKKKKKQRSKKSATTSHPMEPPPPAPIAPAVAQSNPSDASGSMQVVFVATEVAPWSKVGGLGDVMAALPAALAAR